MNIQIKKRVVLLCLILSFLLSGCQQTPAKKPNTPGDVVRAFLVAVKNRNFEEADAYMLSPQSSYHLLSANSLFKESRNFNFSENTLKALDQNMADCIFSIQREQIHNGQATVFVSLNTCDLKQTFDHVKTKIFDDARNADAPLESITLDTQVDPLLYQHLKNKDTQRMNTGVQVHLVKKNHRWLIDNQVPGNQNRTFFDTLIGQ